MCVCIYIQYTHTHTHIFYVTAIEDKAMNLRENKWLVHGKGWKEERKRRKLYLIITF